MVPLGRAAKMLDIAKSTLHNMTRRGIIYATYVEGSRAKHFRIHDLAALSEVVQRGADLKSVADLSMQAYVTARANERRLDDLYDLLGFDRPTLGVAEEDVVALYLRAQAAMTEDIFRQPDIIHHWAGIFYSVDESYLALVQLYTSSEEPWKVFTDLTHRLIEKMPTDSFSTNPPLKSAYAYLSIARNNLRTVAYYYCRQKFGVTVANKVFRHDDDPIQDACRLLFPPLSKVLGARRS